jgi:hypothetical protein
MPPERTAPNEVIGLEEKQRDLIKKPRRRLAQKNPAGPMLILT